MAEEKTKNKKSWLTRNFKYVPPIFISLIVILGHLSFGILESYEAILLSIVTAVIVESILSYVFFGKLKPLYSAYISGISAGILIRSSLIWPFILTPLISILSKYILRYKGQHLFNPTNFGVSWMLYTSAWAVAGLSVQWGNQLLPLIVIWSLGLWTVWKAKRIHITLTYVASFLVFAFFRSQILDQSFLGEVSPLTGPMYQLFIFFMITDPVTNVKSRKGQFIVAFLVAFVEFFLRLSSFIYAPFYALFLVGPIAKFLEIRSQKPE